MQKQCFKCKKTKALDQFYRHKEMADGRLNKCIQCAKTDVRRRYYDPLTRPRIIAYEKQRFKDPKRRARAIEYQKASRARNPGRYRARVKVNNAIKYGKLARKPCEVCGSQPVEAHHTDYRRPLQVQWLCRTHHLEAEGKLTY